MSDTDLQLGKGDLEALQKLAAEVGVSGIGGLMQALADAQRNAPHFTRLAVAGSFYVGRGGKKSRLDELHDMLTGAKLDAKISAMLERPANEAEKMNE